jgi:signal transduction histidine kinase
MNGPKYVLHAFGVPDDLSAAVKFTLYRVLQEILQNIIKHAFAGTITVGLTGTDEGVNLMVEDDGVGFDINQVKEGLGLKNIRSRVRLLNGYFDVDSAPRRGTIYNITIPINH